MPFAILIIAGFVLLVFLVFVLFGGMLANVGGQQVGLIERRYFGKPLPEGRVVAMRGEIGVQARVLQPGLHFLPPFIYKVTKDDMLVIAEDEVGLIESIDGRPLDPGHIFGRRVESHDSFQDGEGFLRNGGQKGPQVDILAPGKYRVNTYLFRMTMQPALIVAQGQVGVVSARDGEPVRPGRLLAHQVEGHQAFQDGEAFVARAASAVRRSSRSAGALSHQHGPVRRERATGDGGAGEPGRAGDGEGRRRCRTRSWWQRASRVTATSRTRRRSWRMADSAGRSTIC